MAYPLDSHAGLQESPASGDGLCASTPADLTASMMVAIGRGARNRCPACAASPLFMAFLKAFQACPSCGLQWMHHRADDFPAYLAILLVGHLLVPAIIFVELALSPPVWVGMILWPSIAGILVLLLLQPAKGAVIAVQWRLGMHGFAAVNMPGQDAVTADR